MNDIKKGAWQNIFNGSYINVLRGSSVEPSEVLYSEEGCGIVHKMSARDLFSSYLFRDDSENNKPAPVVDDTFNDDTPAQTFGQSLNVRFDAAVGSDRGAAFFNKAYDAASERMNEHQLSVECDAPKAAQILNEAVATMVERGKSYDKNGNGAERSMDKIVAMFEALTGIKMTPAQGYKFMACLKLARSEQGEHKEDNYLDGAAYMALAGEAACSEVSA